MAAILETPQAYAQKLRNAYSQNAWRVAPFEAARAHPEIGAPYWLEVFDNMFVWGPGDRTYSVEVYRGWTKTSVREEFLREADAMAFVRKMLGYGDVEQATVIKWTHQQNLPQALPPVVAKSCSMTVYTWEDEDTGELKAKEIDIFGVCGGY
jgi:hypothetical protein